MAHSPRIIQVATNDPDLFGNNQPLPDGVSVRFTIPSERSFMGEAMVAALITIPISVATNIVSSWIYDLWKERKAPKPPILQVQGEYILEVTIETITEAIDHERSSDSTSKN
jgi:hypothetical protein